jgi:hypothetical protein
MSPAADSARDRLSGLSKRLRSAGNRRNAS